LVGIIFITSFVFHWFVCLHQRRVLYAFCIFKMPASRLRL
jgi:hypothetical protein